MRLVKAILFGLVVTGLGAMWVGRHAVLDAYDPSPDSLQLRLSGVDLAVRPSGRQPSPFALPAAPDSRSQPPPVLLLAEAEGATAPVAPPVDLQGGTSSLHGVVVGPDGPVEGAVVAVERHTAHGVAGVRLTTVDGGRWTLGRLLGGRYRVRAWLPGQLTMGRSEVLFVEDGDRTQLDFSLWGVDPAPALELVTGGPVYHGSSGQVAVVVTGRSIDAEGVVVTAPIFDELVAASVTGPMVLVSNPLQPTDASGAARFTLACPAAGSDPAPAAAPTTGPQPPAPGAPAPTTPQVPGAPGSATGQPGGGGQASTLSAAIADRTASFTLPGCQPVPVVDDPGDGAGGVGEERADG